MDSNYHGVLIDRVRIRHFRKEGAETKVTSLGHFGEEDIRKIRQMVLDTRGEILFARAIVLFEGTTERDALPVYAEAYWGILPSDMGISFLDVGGDGGYKPFLNLAHSFQIPWYIFSDGEKEAISNLEDSLEYIGITNYQHPSNVIVLPDGLNYERYIVKGYGDVLIEKFKHDIDSYIDKNDGKERKKMSLEITSKKVNRLPYVICC